MSEHGAQLTFSELIGRHGRIQIPLIQRDYAQGRSDQHEVRQDFLAALQQALCLPPDADTLPLNLDFIYGSVDNGGASAFQPLDGQQRLTTLFLLHWYLAWRDGRSDAFRALCTDDGQSRLSYHVRPSSNEFFNALVAFEPEQAPEDIPAISALIVDQPWYFRNWRLDPTIQSALVMLDAIHQRFQTQHGLYARLTDTERPAITFQLLDLKHFGLSDDLYIKMNARGKPLTPFETFKARYEQILKTLYPDETRALDGRTVTVADFFSHRMDTRWADFFWPWRDPHSHVFDAAVMNLFRAVIMITRPHQSERFIDDIALLRNRRETNSYPFFHQREWLDRPFTDMLIVLLETWSQSGSGLSTQLPDSRYFDENTFFRRLLSEPAGLGYEDIAQLAAYAQYLQQHGDTLDPAEFQTWMRVVFNLSVNTEYNRPADLQRSLAGLKALSPYMRSIQDHLVQADLEIPGFNQQQVAEEKLKARLMRADPCWRALIERAEHHRYFRGQIGFLLAFAGIDAQADPASWPDETRQSLQNAFNDVWQKASAMFGDHGLNSLPDYLWERALLALGDYLLPAGRNYSFLVNAHTEPASWKRLLREHGSDYAALLRALWERLHGTDNLETQLKTVMDQARGLESWRAALIATPEAIRYCQQRMTRHHDDGRVYLLRKLQMNGTHAELFTYCLYAWIQQAAAEDTPMQALDASYLETNSAEEEPCMRLQMRHGNQEIFIVAQYDQPQHAFKLSVPPETLVPDALYPAFEQAGFSQTVAGLARYCTLAEAQSVILALDRELMKTDQTVFR